MMSNALERTMTVVLSISAVTIAGSVAWREFGKHKTATGIAGTQGPEYTSGWEKALSVGIRIGESSARVTVVEFTDLECPGCRRFQTIIREAMQDFPRDVALVFVHMPGLGHRFALQAARAAECAERRGRFAPMVEALFAKQDSFGIKSWGSFALEAGVQDSAFVSNCARDPRPIPRIEAGRALARELELVATPTVFVNGWKFIGPTKEEIRHAIVSTLQGKPLNKG